MSGRFLAGCIIAFAAAVSAAGAQPGPGEKPGPVGPPPPQPPPVPEGTPVLRPGADAHYGRHELFGDFRPDPAQFPVSAGGPLDALTFGGDCVGWVPEAPTLEIFYQPGDTDFPLIFSAIARDADITLAIREPIGIWHCNDDANGTDPMVRIDNAYFGVWGVWLGTYVVSPDEPATVYVSEVGAGWEDFAFPAIQPNLDLVEQELAYRDMFGEGAEARVELAAGFQPDPYTLTIGANGSRAAPGGCAGYIGNGPPDIMLLYTAGDYPLLITAYSETDTVLVVMGPQGQLSCDDDSFGHDPRVQFDDPDTAVYAIWVGTYSQSAGDIPVRVDISERYDLR